MRLSVERNFTETVIVLFVLSVSPATRMMLETEVPSKLASSCWKSVTSTSVRPCFGSSVRRNSSCGGAVGAGGDGVSCGSAVVVAARVIVVGTCL